MTLEVRFLKISFCIVVGLKEVPLHALITWNTFQFKQRTWLIQPLGYKPSALAIELTSSKAIAGKELSLSSWCIASLYIYHCSTVADFSSEKYSGSTGHRNSWYQQRNFQWGCRWWDSNSQPLLTLWHPGELKSGGHVTNYPTYVSINCSSILHLMFVSIWQENWKNFWKTFLAHSQNL